jgi:hypothetical protein
MRACHPVERRRRVFDSQHEHFEKKQGVQEQQHKHGLAPRE